MGWKKACSKGKESKELNKSLEKDVLAYLTPSSDMDVTIYEHKSLGVLALHRVIPSYTAHACSNSSIDSHHQ